MNYLFTIQNGEELHSLNWLAARYKSADLLLDCIPDSDFCEGFPINVFVPEHIAWKILDATEEDGANRGIVPCLGGRLGDEVMKMLEFRNS